MDEIWVVVWSIGIGIVVMVAAALYLCAVMPDDQFDEDDDITGGWH